MVKSLIVSWFYFLLNRTIALILFTYVLTLKASLLTGQIQYTLLFLYFQ